eukprot:TRINITY_DN52224_c0_g1_i1.p1 TRINITY_DN52224_c0_g1~~TRINITY_DN52224_c0_g1_i1.p1  ORF type:complete len:235 (-),score=28.38 TRINITY_DN52224_c0_g1_i1:127-831(-)
MVVQPVQRLKRTVMSLDRRPNNHWRPDVWNGLLHKQKLYPPIRKGLPVFDQTWDILNKRPGAFKQYVPPPKPKPPQRPPETYTPDNLHEILGKFRFEAQGNFTDQFLTEKEVFDAAFALHLVGWVKIRPSFILGHVQGDAYALSYYKRWLEEKHLSRQAGTMEWVRIWNMNLGLERPLAYVHLVANKDRRKYSRKVTHIEKALSSVQAQRLELVSNEKRRDEESFLDANCVRTY